MHIHDCPHPEGSYNEAPSNWREISPDEFASKFFGMPPLHCNHEYRQILMKDSKGKEVYTPVRLFWSGLDLTGVAMVHEYWTKTLRHFAFGCEHDYVELSEAEMQRWEKQTGGKFTRGNCFHNYRCKKCHALTSVDSSD